MDDAQGEIGQSLLLKAGAATSGATITSIDFRLDVNSFAHVPATSLASNDIVRATLTLDRPLGIEPFDSCRALGSFILIDRTTHATVAAGMVRVAGRRALLGIAEAPVRVDRAARERLNGHPARLVAITGGTADDRLALAEALELRLHGKGKRTMVLAGRHAAVLAPALLEAGMIVLVAGSLAPERFPSRWNHLLDKKERKTRILERRADAIRSDTSLALMDPASQLVVVPGQPLDRAVDQALAAISFDAEDGTLFHL
jgi:hypothetical protein